MRTWLVVVVLVGGVVVATGAGVGPACADEFIETFDAGSNAGGWTYGAPTEGIATSGGHPGAYLHASGLDTYAPYLHTGAGASSIFTGDYHSMHVTSIGVDLETIAVDFSADERECTPMLRSDNGTPDDDQDDWAAYYLGPYIPVPGDGWAAYDFTIPWDATSWPSGWSWVALGPGAPASPDWAVLMNDVTQVGFFYGNPEYFFIFQMWELGADNLRITADNTVVVQSRDWGAVKSLFR